MKSRLWGVPVVHECRIAKVEQSSGSRVVAAILLKSVEGSVYYCPKGKASLRRIGLNSGLGAISGSLLGSS